MRGLTLSFGRRFDFQRTNRLNLLIGASAVIVGMLFFTCIGVAAQARRVRNQLQTLIENAFVCTTVAGATMQNARTVPVGTTENWEILGVQVQFYFDEVI